MLTYVATLDLEDGASRLITHKHIFHDQVHPSQEVHQILASRMCDFIVNEFGSNG